MKESEHLELKKSTSEIKEAMISIVSILNKHQKGELYFGIKNNGEIVGQTVTENTIREISQTIAQHIEPKIFPTINEVVLEAKKCVRVEFGGNDIPYYAYGRAYVRVGDEDKKISPQEIEHIIIRKNKDKLQWDIEFCLKAKLKDIDEKKIKAFVKLAGLKHGSVKSSLEKLGLMKEEKLLNTAVLFFGKHPEDFFPNARLRCAVFGETTATTIDMQDFVGDVFTLIEKAEKYILENIHIGMRVEGLYRIDVPEIDRAAFREAIINAFCHRDYHEFDSVNIAIFKGRLEIRNPGGLYGGLTIEKIKKEEVSRRRNELIAEMFHRIHFGEKWGRGIKLILSKEPTTDFKIVAGIFITLFKRKIEQTEGLVDGLVEGLVENQKRILNLIAKNPRISKREMSKTIGISTTAIDKNIEALKKKGLLKRLGSAKGGYWEINKSLTEKHT
ncbi:putative DNA binding domain-containing protein [Candidatus Woesearchaeota archaeon]|nr:putative DNA binding domain-containing protein [Candidatus Woesearchaeota archaeon]